MIYGHYLLSNIRGDNGLVPWFLHIDSLQGIQTDAYITFYEDAHITESAPQKVTCFESLITFDRSPRILSSMH